MKAITLPATESAMWRAGLHDQILATAQSDAMRIYDDDTNEGVNICLDDGQVVAEVRYDAEHDHAYTLRFNDNGDCVERARW